MKRVYLVSGKAGSGKTTFSKFCVSQVHNGIVVPIASTIKHVATIMGWNGEKDAKGRRLLVELGKIGREYDQDLWVKLTVNNILADNEHGVFFIDDWRFKNEYYYITEHLPNYQITTIRIVRPNYTDPYVDVTDATEIDLDDWGMFSYTINNSGTIEDLYKQALWFLDKEGILEHDERRI